MKNRDLLLSAMGDMEDDFLMEANEYTKKTRHIRKRGVLIAAAVEGYLLGQMNILLRVIAGVGSYLLIDSGLVTDIAGIACLAVIILAQKVIFHKVQPNVS